MQFFQQNKSKLEKEILSQCGNLTKKFGKNHVFSVEVTKVLSERVVSGKMLRGQMVLLSALDSKGKYSKDALKIAATVELLHTGILIHDDIMDGDDMRRNKPTIHALYAKKQKQLSPAKQKQFGEGIASCIAIICYFLAVNAISEIKTNGKVALEIMRLIAAEMSLLGLGQVQDMYSGLHLMKFSEKDVLKLYEHKTGKYTFGLPLTLGLKLAGKKMNTKYMDKLSLTYGHIFQLQDDYLNVFGDPKITGKSTLSDIREKKQTMLYFKLIKTADGKDKTWINKVYSSKVDLTEQDIEAVAKLMLKYEISSYVEETLENEATKAVELLDKLPFSDYQKDQMLSLTNYLVTREK